MTKEKIEELIKELTLVEKIDMIHGNELFRTKAVERLGIPALTTSDGPMGVRQDYEKTKWLPMGFTNDKTSYLPSNTALAATWNINLAFETGNILGKEARGRGKDMILAPGINLQRSPLCGRNFEYMGEDPYLVSELVVPLIKGIEKNDVSSCVKHFAVNNQETKRLSVDVTVSDRALHELYLPGFKAAVQKGEAKAIMGAYNKFRGQHCCHNDLLLNKILREEWGFDGVVVSDWGGVHDTLEAAFHGLDIEMSVTDDFDHYFMANALKLAVEEGKVEESVIDEKVRRVLSVMNRLNMLDGERKPGSYNNILDREKLLQVARESVVLLKNDNHLLPLKTKKGMKILVVGDNANRTQATGGGSAEIKALYEITPLLGIAMEAGGNVTVTYEQGYDANTSGNIWDEEHQEKESWQAVSLEESADKSNYHGTVTEEMETKNKELAVRAVEAAKKADVVIYVGGLNHEHDTEGKDREELTLPYNQDELINHLLIANPNTVIVMLTGSPVGMNQWIHKAKTLVYSWYAGMEGGHALGEILFGKVNPSGKLPETLPISIETVPSHTLGEFPGGDSVNYGEGVFVGYRYYDTYHVPTLFSFGYGMSYTSFDIKNLKIINNSDIENVNIAISVEATNAGKMPGAETIQVYIHSHNNSVIRPDKELRAFHKVFLKEGETQSVLISLDASAFTYFDEEKDCFFAEKGTYSILVGNCVSNIILSEKIELKEDYTVSK